MSIIKRFKTIMASNVHAFLDKNNPEKDVKKFLHELQKDFGNVKAELEAMASSETRKRRKLNEYRANCSKMEKYAQKSLERGEEWEARTFLEKKQLFEEKQQLLEKELAEEAKISTQLRQMYEKLSNDIQKLEYRIATIGGQSSMGAVKKKLIEADTHSLRDMEEKAERAMYEAEALEELRRSSRE